MIILCSSWGNDPVFKILANIKNFPSHIWKNSAVNIPHLCVCVKNQSFLASRACSSFELWSCSQGTSETRVLAMRNFSEMGAISVFPPTVLSSDSGCIFWWLRLPAPHQIRVDEHTHADSALHEDAGLSVWPFLQQDIQTSSIHKKIVDCKHGTNIWTDSLVCHSLCRIPAQIEWLRFLTILFFPHKKNEAIIKTKTSCLVLICHRVNTKCRTWTARVNWFQLSCAHTVSGPSSYRCRHAGRSGLPSRPT